MTASYIDKLAYIYVKDGRVLVTLTRGRDAWYIPGGKREGDETDHQALIREVQEELSVDLQPDTIKFYGVFEAQAHNKPPGTIVRMTCYTADFDGELTCSNEIEKLDFFDHSQKSKTSHVDFLIFDDLKEKGLIE